MKTVNETTYVILVVALLLQIGAPVLDIKIAHATVTTDAPQKVCNFIFFDIAAQEFRITEQEYLKNPSESSVINELALKKQRMFEEGLKLDSLCATLLFGSKKDAFGEELDANRDFDWISRFSKEQMASNVVAAKVLLVAGIYDAAATNLEFSRSLLKNQDALRKISYDIAYEIEQAKPLIERNIPKTAEAVFRERLAFYESISSGMTSERRLRFALEKYDENIKLARDISFSLETLALAIRRNIVFGRTFETFLNGNYREYVEGGPLSVPTSLDELGLNYTDGLRRAVERPFFQIGGSGGPIGKLWKAVYENDAAAIVNAEAAILYYTARDIDEKTLLESINQSFLTDFTPLGLHARESATVLYGLIRDSYADTAAGKAAAYTLSLKTQGLFFGYDALVLKGGIYVLDYQLFGLGSFVAMKVIDSTSDFVDADTYVESYGDWAPVFWNLAKIQTSISLPPLVNISREFVPNALRSYKQSGWYGVQLASGELLSSAADVRLLSAIVSPQKWAEGYRALLNGAQTLKTASIVEQKAFPIAEKQLEARFRSIEAYAGKEADVATLSALEAKQLKKIEQDVAQLTSNLKSVGGKGGDGIKAINAAANPELELVATDIVNKMRPASIVPGEDFLRQGGWASRESVGLGAKQNRVERGLGNRVFAGAYPYWDYLGTGYGDRMLVIWNDAKIYARKDYLASVLDSGLSWRTWDAMKAYIMNPRQTKQYLKDLIKSLGDFNPRKWLPGVDLAPEITVKDFISIEHAEGILVQPHRYYAELMANKSVSAAYKKKLIDVDTYIGKTTIPSGNFILDHKIGIDNLEQAYNKFTGLDEYVGKDLQAIAKKKFPKVVEEVAVATKGDSKVLLDILEAAYLDANSIKSAEAKALAKLEKLAETDSVFKKLLEDLNKQKAAEVSAGYKDSKAWLANKGEIPASATLAEKYKTARFVEVQEPLINRILGEGKKAKVNGSPTAVYVAGAPGAGKTTSMVERFGADYKSKYIYINADEIIASLPGHRGINSEFYRQEANDIMLEIERRAIQSNSNIIHDLTLRNQVLSEGAFKTMKEVANYNVEVMGVIVNPAVSIERTTDRFIADFAAGEAPRYVDASYIATAVPQINENLIHWAKTQVKEDGTRGLIDKITLFSNNESGKVAQLLWDSPKNLK